MAWIETITGNVSIVDSTYTNAKKGDYIGFTYNGKHSSELGIVRTSDGSRFNENLLPTMQDKTVQVPGADGTYYFGSYYTQRQFNVSFAFDSLTEFQVAQLKRHFGDKGIHELIFDECPYKVYSAKVTGTATIKYIAFSEGETNRLYKGEGSIQFTCYNPFARSNYKFLNKYREENCLNIEEWKDASGMRESEYVYTDVNIDEWGTDPTNPNNKYRFVLFNPGDLESDWVLTIPLQKGDGTASLPASLPALQIGLSGDSSSILKLSEVTSSKSTSIKINSKTNLIEGYDKANQKTGELFNHCIKEGSFFKIPIIKEATTQPDGSGGATKSLFVKKGNGEYIPDSITPSLEYNYWYF